MVDGKAGRQCLEHQPQTSLRASGPVPVARHLSRPADGGTCRWPLTLRAGILVGFSTPVLARQGASRRGHMTADEPSPRVAELGLSGLSRRRGDRGPTRRRAVWERPRASWEDALRQPDVVLAEASVVAVSLAGGMVPAQEAQREAKATREAATQPGWSTQRRGPAGDRAVGCGTGTREDEEAKRLATVCDGRAPASQPQTLTAALEAALASRLAVRPAVAVVARADGAEATGRAWARPSDATAPKRVDPGHARPHRRAARAADDGAQRGEGRAPDARLRSRRRDPPGGAGEVSAARSRWARTRGASATRSAAHASTPRARTASTSGTVKTPPRSKRGGGPWAAVWSKRQATRAPHRG